MPGWPGSSIPATAPRQSVQIDVAASKNNSHALRFDVDYALSNGGIRNSRRGLDDYFHRFPNRPHGRDDRFLGHCYNVIHVTLNDREVRLADICPQSVGDREFLLSDDPSPRAKRL